MAFYSRLLADLGLGTGDRAFVIGSDAEASTYDLIAPSDRHSRSPAERLGRSLGSEWGDAEALSANSIARYDEYARTGGPKVRQLLDYNSDDVVASAVVLDGPRALDIAQPAPRPLSN